MLPLAVVPDLKTSGGGVLQLTGWAQGRMFAAGVAATVLTITGLCAAVPAAAADYDVTVIGGVDTTSVNRGRRSRQLNPSPFAAIEIVYDDFLGGVVSTPTKIIDEVRPLTIGYLEYRPSIDKYKVIVGARYYAFIASSDFKFDIDNDGVTDKTGRKGFFEANLGVRRRFDVGELTARTFYSPNVFGETGDAFYGSISGKAFLGDDWSLRAHVGVSEYDDTRFNDDYWNYAVGVYKYAWGFDLFLRYSDTVNLAGRGDSIVVFGFEKAFTLASSDRDRRRRFEKIRNDLIIDKAFLGGVSATP